MAQDHDSAVLRRKIAASNAGRGEGGPGADRGWRLALARAARERLHLALEVERLGLEQVSLAELLELPPERALIVLLQGPGEGVGLLVLAPEVLAGMIEVQTLGRVAATPLVPRRPTRTDAAMVADVLDAALIDLERVLAEEADLIWAGGFRYASFLDDPRPLALLLEDLPYKLLQAEVVLGQAARRGTVLLALPAEGRGLAPRQPDLLAEAEAQAGSSFAAALAAHVEAADCVLDAVLTRVEMTIARVMALAPGDVVPLQQAGLDRLTIVGLDGRPISEGKLGQQRGMRAIRLVPQEAAQPLRRPALATVAVPAETAMEPQRQIA